MLLQSQSDHGHRFELKIDEWRLMNAKKRGEEGGSTRLFERILRLRLTLHRTIVHESFGDCWWELSYFVYNEALYQEQVVMLTERLSQCHFLAQRHTGHMSTQQGLVTY